ncbi:MAG: ATP-binding protein [Bacteroidota bacterium]
MPKINLCDAQEDIAPKVQELKARIFQLEGGQKLKLMDSLSRLISYDGQPEFKFDSITRATIHFAYELDSIDIALARTNALLFYYANRVNNPKEGIKLLKDFERRNMLIEDYDMLARLYTNAGDAYFFSGALEASIPIYEKAENFALKDKDTSLYATARTYKAAAYVDTGDYATGSKLLKETTSIFMQQKDTTNLLIARNTLAIIYSKMGFYKEAKQEREQVSAIALLRGDYNAFIPNLFNLSIEAKKQGHQHLRINYLKTAYREIEKLHKPYNYTPIIIYGLLSAYAQNDSLTKAKIYFDKITEYYAKKDPIPFEYAYRSALADYYYSTESFAKALEEAQKVLEIHLGSNNTEGIYQSYEQLAKIKRALGDFENAYLFFTKYNRFKDSINSLQKAKALSYYQTLYETEKRDFKIAEQASEISLLNTKNKLHRQWLLFGGLSVLILFIITYLWRSRQYARHKKRLQEKFSQDLITEQENEHSRLAMELHDSVGQKLMLLKKNTKKLNDEHMEALAEGALDELRSISRGLYPAVLNRFGFSKAIWAMVDEIDSSSDILFTLDIENIDEHISKEAAIHLYRIIQECLNNILKHSKAKAVAIDIEKENQSIHTTITDNGKGFEVSKAIRSSRSLGMNTLLKRAKIIKSKIHIDSLNNKGTTVNIITPIYVMDIS